MNRSEAPKKQPVPFGTNGSREDLLSTTPAGDQRASYDAGFPPVTMILKASGGLPPKGQDMNQILFELSAIGRWLSAGALNSFDATFATAIAGYPKGAVLLSDDASKIFISTADANTNNPNTVTTGWLNLLSFLGGAPIASPALTGIPTAPTAAAGTNTTQLATTAFVAATLSGRLMGAPQLFTASGTYTPTTGCKLAIVELVGGGGGGGGCYLADSGGASAGGGGGSGGYSMYVFSTPVATAVTIGSGGTVGAIAANTTPSPGGNGGDTLFGALATAKGGKGGLSAGWAVAVGTTDTACSNGGGGADVGTGTISNPGSSGGLGLQLKLNGSGGLGASSRLGSGGQYASGTYTAVAPTKGGGGIANYRASGVSYPGTAGAAGFIMVWEYF